MGDYQNKEFLPSVSTSLALAAGIGIIEAVALSVGSGSLMNILGIPVVGAGNLLNAVLDPILIFFAGLGIGGAAIATVISETFPVFLTMTLATSMAARQFTDSSICR